jgi:hypothetical protein
MTKHLSRKPSLEGAYRLAEGEKAYILARKQALKELKDAKELELMRELKKTIVRDGLELPTSRARQL